MRTVFVVVAILGAVVLIQAAVWIPLLGAWRRRSDSFLVDFESQATASGERLVAGPERAVYRGGTRPYSAMKGNGTILLTDRRLVFRKLTGGLVEVPVANIVAVRRAPSFRGSQVGGQTHLVVATADRAEVGFLVQDIERWRRLVEPKGSA